MRTRTLAACFTILSTLAAPTLADPAPTHAAQVVRGPERRAASADELDRYAQRELQARDQEKFEGGRMRNSDLVTIILVLVVVILVLAII
jgi:hypothetical protein